jgi:hypothetical protein
MNKLLVCTFALLCLLASPYSTLACACCVDEGTYFINTMRPESYMLDIFDEIKFDAPADLYMTEAGWDGIKGLSGMDKDENDGKPIDLTVAEDFVRNRWEFTIKSASGREGKLTLPMPKTYVKFGVDLREPREEGSMVSIYKELRFKGPVGPATGFLKKGIAPGTTYFLVLQGRGNGCDNASDFTHWRLEVTGPKADYALFGDLKNSAE